MISLNSFPLKATPNNTCIPAEISCKEISAGMQVEKDSIFSQKYELVKKKVKKEKFTEALEDALEIYGHAKKNAHKENLFLITLLVADIYKRANNNKRALEYFKESLQVLRSGLILDKKNTDYSVKYLAKTYLRIGSEFQKASKKDSALYYYTKIEKLTALDEEFLKYKAVSFSNVSGIYETDSLFEKAIFYVRKSIDIHKKINNKIDQAGNLNNLGNIYLSMHNYAKSKENYLKGIQLIKNDNSHIATILKADLYFNLAWAMRNLKDYEAYDYHYLSTNIEHEIREKQVRRMVEEVTAKFDLEAVKKEAKNRFRLYGAIGLIVILCLLFGLNFYKLKQKNLGLKLSQTQLLQSQHIEKLKSESQTRVLNATIDAKESERKEIAETLHDSVCALLSSANLHLMATKSQFRGKIPIEIDKSQSIIVEASQKIRDLSHSLVSSVLLNFGLHFAVKDMTSKCSNSALYMLTDIHSLTRYDQNFEIKIYNIIQEFLNNILKHSKAKNSIIKLFEQNNRICFQISDDGIGFDVSKIAVKGGLGINQINARIQMMNGEFLIESAAGEGTTIYVELPVIKKNAINHV